MGRDISSSEGYHPLLGVRIPAPACGSGVVTAEGRVWEPAVFSNQTEYLHLSIYESIDFCFGSTNTVQDAPT